jgi:LysM repeat protein
MWVSSRLSVFCLSLSLFGAGCSPTAETPADDKNPHYQAGKERSSALDYKGAVECFERALEDNPRSVLAHYELGVLFEQKENDYAAALYHYNKAVQLRPNGYPSDNIRQRIPACKQELVKADSLAVINPTVLRETERLREENRTLRKQLEALQAHLAGRPPEAPGQGATSLANSQAPVTNIVNARSLTTPSLERARVPGSASGSSKTHVVKTGETLAAISRRYQIKISSLQSANPGVDPKRLRAGQVLNVP